MKKTVYGYLHTHWDREWYRNKEDFNIRLQNVFDIVIDELLNNRAPFFYFDGQVCALLDYLKYNPEKENIVRDLIKKNKLAIGPYFVSADTYLVSFPCMLKNLEIGLKYSRQFNQKEFIGYMSDVFGVSKSAFSALKLNNINKAVIWRGVNPEAINNNCNFKYDNIDALWLVQGYFNDFIHNNNIEGLKKYLDKIFKYSNQNCLLPIGADHLGMLKNASETIKKINSKLDDYEIKLTSIAEYFKNNKFENQPKTEEFLDNSDSYILQGVYSTRINQKIKNIEIENKLSKIIEPLNYYLKEKYSAQIEEIYKTLLKNHAHDSIYGCSIDCVKNKVDNRFDKCNEMLESILLHIKYNFKNKKKIKDKSTNKIGIFNLSNKNIKKVKIKLPYILKNAQVIDTKEGFWDELLSDSYKIPITEDICKIYTQLVEISNNEKFSFNTVKIKKPITVHKIANNKIENENISLYIRNNKIFLQSKTNVAELKLTDIKDKGDTYNFAPSGKRKELPLLKSEILYKGEIESAIRLYFKEIKLDAIIDNHSKFIRFKINIKNKTKNHKLQLCILSDKDIKSTIAQDAVGTIKRTHNPNYKMENYMPAKRPIELKTNSYPMQNFVVANNIIALTKGLQEYEIYKNEIRICLIRSTGTISNPKNSARSIPAGPDLKTPDAQILGEVNEEFAVNFGNAKTAFYNLDEFMENYVTIEGEFNKDIAFKFDEIEDNCFFYGLSKNKKILYNFKNKKTNLI